MVFARSAGDSGKGAGGKTGSLGGSGPPLSGRFFMMSSCFHTTEFPFWPGFQDYRRGRSINYNLCVIWFSALFVVLFIVLFIVLFVVLFVVLFCR